MLLRRFISSVTVFLSMAILVIAGTGPVAAASSPGGNGLRISPVRSDLTINAGSSQTIDVYITNLTSSSADLQGVVNDFTAGTDESGTPYILLNGQKAPSHSLKGFVSGVDSTFTLAPKETKDLKVTINIPTGTSAGGYFGTVRFLPAATNTNKNLNLTASVGSLLIVTVPGNYREQMSIESFDVRRLNTSTKTFDSPSVIFTSNKDLNGVVRFNNSGDVQEQPFGKILLKKGSTILGTYEINNTTPRGNVLPGSIRHFWVPLTGLGSFGKYTLEGNFGYGSKGQLLSATTTFYIIPVGIIILAVIILLLILFAIFVLPKLIRKYNRGVIKRASSRARR
jgi:hypothetical protein